MDIRKYITRPNPVIFDIGCNNGADTLSFRSQFPDAEIYSFEPEPNLAKNLANLPAHFFELAVSNIDGAIPFYPSNNWNPAGSTLIPNLLLESHSWIEWGKPILVYSTTLDTFINEYEIDIIDFIWADVQGAEEYMILGGTDTFRRKVKYLYTEYSIGELYETATTLERIRELLPDYELVEMFDTNIHGGNVLLRNTKL